MGKVDLISARKQDHQLYTIIKRATIFTCKLYTNQKQHLSSLFSSINFREIYIPTITIFLKMSPLYSYILQAMLDNFYSK